jgi:hypothetical protein
MHKGAQAAQAHFSRAVRDVHNNTCHDRWIGRGGPTAWLPRSPDSNPTDFYLWRYLKSLACAASADNERHFTIAIWMPVLTNRNHPGISKRMRRSMRRRVQACIESHGGYCEHLL